VVLRTLLILTALLLALLPTAASAQPVLIQPFAGISFGGQTNIIDLDKATKLRKVTWGGTVSVIGRGVFGVEGDFAVIPGFFERDTADKLVTDSSVVTLMGNVVLALPLSMTGQSLRPYFSAGAGLMRASIKDLADIFSSERNLVGIDLGGGLIGFLSERWGVRWDVRYFKSVSEPGDTQDVLFGSASLSFWRVNMAFVLKY
jgi:Outer membrane protein beta-barrel domain